MIWIDEERMFCEIWRWADGDMTIIEQLYAQMMGWA